MSLRLPFRRDHARGIYVPAVPNEDFKGDREVLMIRTVVRSGKWEYLANRRYKLVPEKADEFIIKGYAMGTLSRNYSDDERLELLANVQTVNLGG